MEVNLKFGIIGSDIVRQSFLNLVESCFHCKYTVHHKLPFSDSKDSPGIKRLLHSVFSKDYGINAENLPTKPFIPFPFENLLNHAVCGLRER